MCVCVNQMILRGANLDNHRGSDEALIDQVPLGVALFRWDGGAPS